MTHPTVPTDPVVWRDCQRIARGLQRMLTVAAVFCVVLTALLLINHARMRASAPLDSPQLAELRGKLALDPRDETIKTQIRQIDQQLRADYFQRLARAWWGGRLLAGGVVVLLISFYFYRKVRPLPPEPRRGPDRDTAVQSELRSSRRALGLFSVATAGVTVVLWLVVSPPPGEAFSVREPATGSGAGSAAILPAGAGPGVAARNWPRFRGPSGDGVSQSAQLPAPWVAENGPRVLWQLPLDQPGNSSPIVWGERLFLTVADAENRRLLGIDTAAGKLVWTVRADRIQGSPTEPPEVMEDTGFAAPTPATDGERVYAIFANGDLIACSLSGQRVWTRALGMPENHYGHAASLLVWRDTLFVPWDRDSAASLLALDAATGKTKWEIPRKVEVSWTTPIVISTPAGEQLITSAVPQVIAYRPSDGRQLWSTPGLQGEFGASPVFDGRQVFAIGVDSTLMAIPLPAIADPTAGAALLAPPAWTVTDDLPDITSPLTDGARLWTITTQGVLTCYATVDGRRLYQHEFEEDFLASPIVAGDRLLFVSAKGRLYLIAAADEFKLLAQADLNDTVAASPALVPGRLYIRGAKHLICIDTLPAGELP